MLRDKFIFGLRDDMLKGCLLMRDTTKPTLEQAVLLAQCSESLIVQVKQMSTASVNYDEIRRLTSQHSTHQLNHIPCRQCRRRHCSKEFPAFGQQCTQCYKLNHFPRVCRAKKVLTGTPATQYSLLKIQS